MKDIRIPLRAEEVSHGILPLEGALPICEQCNSSGNSKPVEIVSDDGQSAGFRVSMIWTHKPFGEADCRYVYFCDECFWALQANVYGGVEPWFDGADVYGIHPDCRQCQERTQLNGTRSL